MRTLFLFTVCPPMSGTLFFFRAEMFGLLKDKIPLVCWSQGSGYSLSVSIGSLYGVRPNQIPPKGKFSQKKRQIIHILWIRLFLLNLGTA